jgi:hypothetical protein
MKLPSIVEYLYKSLFIIPVFETHDKAMFSIPHLVNREKKCLDHYVIVANDIMSVYHIHDPEGEHKDLIFQTKDEEEFKQWFAKSIKESAPDIDALGPKDEAMMIEKTFTIKAFPETMEMFERFLAMLHYNQGSSYTYGVAFDGDGCDILRVSPAPPREYYEQFEEIDQNSSGSSLAIIANHETYYSLNDSELR